ncbi:MAG: hypothetical protein KBT32_03300 [Bacteroidales bacterium]|nr:hypothetical protein [Candidatus Physcocola equi]
MNTKFFFSAIAMFAITTVANAAPLIRRAEIVRVNEEVATSAVIKGARVTGVNEEVATGAVIRRAEAVRVNEEVATSAVIKGAQVSGVNEEVATSAVVKGVEFKSGMEVARIGRGIIRVNDTENPTVFTAKLSPFWPIDFVHC